MNKMMYTHLTDEQRDQLAAELAEMPPAEKAKLFDAFKRIWHDESLDRNMETLIGWMLINSEDHWRWWPCYDDTGKRIGSE
jgi:hypothetical protein